MSDLLRLRDALLFVQRRSLDALAERLAEGNGELEPGIMETVNHTRGCLAAIDNELLRATKEKRGGP